jgi:hypothetical protein
MNPVGIFRPHFLKSMFKDILWLTWMFLEIILVFIAAQRHTEASTSPRLRMREQQRWFRGGLNLILLKFNKLEQTRKFLTGQ